MDRTPSSANDGRPFLPKAKADDRLGRFREIVADPNNQRIPRVPHAGMLSADPAGRTVVVMHNGLHMHLDSYYGPMAEILVINRGVHEPQEELVFGRVLERLGTAPTMIELGAYWGFYSAWFKARHPDGRVVLVEPDPRHLQAGRDNFALNGLEGEFHANIVGPGGFDVARHLETSGIEHLDLLHADIQGAELHLLTSIRPLLEAGRISYLFVSTHSQELHRQCRDLVTACRWRLVADADFERESFCFDGVLVACRPDIEFGPIELFCRADGDAIDTVGFEE